MADYPLTDAIGWALVHFTWQGALIGAAAAGGLMLLRGAAATVRYAVACAALASMLAAPLVTAQRMYSSPTTREFTVVRTEVPAVMPATADQLSTLPLRQGGSSSSAPAQGLLPLAVYAWIAGVAFLSLRLTSGWFTVAGLRRRGTRPVRPEVQRRIAELSARLRVPGTVRVMESAIVSVPALVGWLRPVILLPASVVAGLPAAHLDAVLAHELAHVRRHDYLVNALQAIVETLLFYHPAVWWCSRQLRIEREHCCDDLAVTACGDRVAYATALTALEDLRRTDLPLALAATGGRLIDRVRRVLGAAPAHDGRARVWAAAVGLALIVMLALSSETLGRADAAGPPLAEPDGAGDITEPDRIGPHLKSGNLFTFAWDALSGWHAPRPLPPPRPPRPPRPSTPPRLSTPPWFQVAPAPVAPTQPAPPAPMPPAPPPPPTPPTPPPSRGYGENTMIRSDRWGTVRITHRGSIALNDDDTDIVAMSPGAYFNVTESAWWVPDILRDWVGVRREIVIRGRADGTTARAYYSGERRQPFDPRGRDWMRALLPDLARHGFGAEARIARILKSGGAAALAAEIPRLRGDYLRSLYMRHALRQGALTPRGVAVLLQAARFIRSDYEQSLALIEVARTQPIDADTAPEFFRAVDTIQSDYEQRRVLSAAAQTVSDPAVIAGMFRSASGLGSDYEQAEFLRMAVSRKLATQAPEAFFHAVNTIDSDYEQRRVLLSLLNQPLDAPTVETALRSASRLGSGYERAEFLIAAARRGLDQQARETFFQAIDGVGSDHEQRRVLATIAARPTLDDASLASMLDRAMTLRNDFDRAEYLIALARRHPIQGPLRDAYIRAADAMRSDHEQSRALVELLRTERASR